MSLLSLNPNNKNQYRRYPLKQGVSLVSEDGYVLPDSIIVNCSITSTYGYHRIYIQQIFFKSEVVRITIASAFNDESLGVFTGSMQGNFTTLNLTPFKRFISGTLTIATSEVLQSVTRLLNFNRESAELEESTIFCYNPPAVRSLSDKRGYTLRGEVNFGILTGLTKTKTSIGSNLRASNPDAVFNLKDKSSLIGNCPTPTIKNINGVFPFNTNEGSTENDGNIYVAGVKPIIFYGIPGENTSVTPGVVGIDTGNVTLDSLCTQKHKLLPPIDVSGFTLDNSIFVDKYYSKPALPAAAQGSLNYPLSRPERLASNFNATQRPEYYYWPQFVKAEYYNLWSTPRSE